MKLLEYAKKKGTQDWEIAKLNTILHTKMVKQQQETQNGAANQRTNQPPQVNSSGCVNPGFEDGTTNGWTLFDSNISGVNLPCNTCPTTPGAITNVVSSSSTVAGQCTSGTDIYGNFSVLPPTGGGSYALLLNDANAGGKIEQAQYSFVVNSSSDFFTFQYAAVLQSGGHPANEQLYFSVTVTDLTNNNSLSSGCTDYQASAPASGNLAGWSISSSDPTVYTKNWTTVGIDLSSVIGHTVNINFTVSDCNQGGHFGYCYIDASCSNIISASNVTGICGTAGSNIAITAPPGFASYQWYGPNSPYHIINGATSSTYSIATASAVDTFMVKTVFSSGCLDSFKIVVKPILNITAFTTSTCKGNPTPTGSATVTAGPGNFGYVWNGPSGAMGTFTTTAQNNLPPGTYTVQVVDNTGKCPSKDTTIVVAAVNPILQLSTVQFCGSTPTIVAPNALLGTNYTWYNNSNAPTGVTTQSNTLANAINGQHYTVTYLDSATHCEDSLKLTLNKTSITFAAQPQNPCSGGNNGALTYNNTTTPNVYPIYNWAVNGSTTASGTVSATAAVNLSNLSSGSYTMVVSVPGNVTCCDTIVTPLVNTGVVVPTLITLSPNCNMDTLKIVSVVPNVTHNWSGTATSNSPIPSSNTTTLTVYPTFTNTVAGYYNYTDSMYSQTGHCLSVTKYTAALKSFKGSLTALEKLSCYNDSTGKIKASVTSEVNGPISTPDKYTFTWLPSTLTTTTAIGSPCSSTKTNLKSNTYICTISNGNCINTYTYNLTNPAPLINDSIYAYYCPKDSLALLVADTNGNTNIRWHQNNVVGSVAGDSIHVVVANINNYYVTYKHNGCPDTGKVIISVNVYDAFRPDELVNVFTPNADKKNDFFYPFYSKTLNQYQIFKQSDTYQLYVYDRWGKLVYSATDYDLPWDGKTKSGHDADNGTYFFVVKYKSNCGSNADLVEKKGFVELMR